MGGFVLSLTRSVVRTLLSLVVLSLPVGACSFVVSTDSYKQGCTADKKRCESQTPGVFICVSKTDPSYGCATESCVPCTLPHVNNYACRPDGTCGVGTCNPPWAACDTNPSNGCETNTSMDATHCGSCPNDCTANLPLPNAESVRCASGQCRIDRCAPGFLDCDLGTSDGCEVPFSVDRCGRCTPCAPLVCDMAAMVCRAPGDGGT